MALTEEERQVFDQAADLAATGQDASPYLTDKLVAIIDRLLAEETDRD